MATPFACPQLRIILLKTFKDLGLAEPILRAVEKEGYENPTPIQADVIPALMEGKDVLGIAQTGTGKTAAFVLPLLHWIRESKDRPVKRGCSALILAPTRELAAQINESIRTYSRFMQCSTALVVGGARPGPQIQAIARGVDIIVATPGRLMDHMAAGKVRLDFVESFVLDEADQMLDMGFMPAIRKIVGALPRDRQTVLLSATMPKPIRALAQDILIDPQEISVSPSSRPIEQIEQRIMHVQKTGKRDALVGILRGADVERTVVFTRTKRGADKVCEHLEKAGLAAAAIHGDKSQGQRERALQAFKKGKVATLVATDIAARGIDIDGVTHVVNFELPNVPEAYVHRIGRTGRAGKSGIAISLCDHTEKGLLRDIERLIGRRIGDPDGSIPIEDDRSQGPKGKPRNKRGGFGGKPNPKNRNRNRNNKPQQRRGPAAPAAPAAAVAKTGPDGSQGLRRK